MNENGKFKKIITNILYIVLPTITIIYQCEYNDAMYQSDKDIATAKALLAFMIYLFIVAKVKLFNWPSLLATIALVPIHFKYRSIYIESPDILGIINFNVWTQWLALMILIEIILNFRKDKLKKINWVSFALYVLIIITMTITRHGRTEPLLLVWPFLLSAFIERTKEENENLIYRLCDSWLLSFAYIMIKSFIENPYQGDRYYGCFVNIGAFGVFLGGVFAIALFRVVDARIRWGRKNIKYALIFLWFLLVIAAMWIVDTRTLACGIILSVSFMFILTGKDRKSRLKRMGVVLALIALFVGLFAVLIAVMKNLDEEFWKEASTRGGLLGPVYFFVQRILYMFDKTTSFNNKIVDPKSLFNILDKFTSGRLLLSKLFFEQSTLMGTIGEGIKVRKYYAFNAHNAYIHAIYLYGIGGVSMIIYLIYSAVVAVRGYLKEHSVKWLFVISVLPMTLGLMLGEVLNFYYAVLFLTFIALRPVIIKED